MADSLIIQSPDYVKISHATAMSLGLMRGRMYRGAVNRCANLLVHYPEGCSAGCAYCGLSKKRSGTYADKSFIHVAWPVYPMGEIVNSINDSPPYVRRVCISMITNGKCRSHTIEIARILSNKTGLPVSVLVAPTIIKKDDLIAMKEAGVDKVGVAVDLATPELFERYRGKQVSGPHKWSKYWDILGESVEIFGKYNTGAHLMVGMGETERQMSEVISKLWGMGVMSHLFSFFAEKGSELTDRPQPPWPVYLRIQMARYLIEEGLISLSDIVFDETGRITDFGLGPVKLQQIIKKGTPFMTTGCIDKNGQVACNRPFGNCLPDVRQWNYPYHPDEEEIDLIRANILNM